MTGRPLLVLLAVGIGACASSTPGGGADAAVADAYRWPDLDRRDATTPIPDGRPSPDAAEQSDGGLPTGEVEIARNGASYAYRPAVYAKRVVWAEDKVNGTQDDVFLHDLPGNTTDPLVQQPGAQGHAVIHGDNVVWVDFRNQQGGDGNSDIYLLELQTGQEHRVTLDAKGQYDPEIFGRMIVWRDDRNAGSSTAGDIYAYDMGPDARFGTADDRGEHQITDHSADQTAPDVYVGPDDRVTVVWYDLRDNGGRPCAAICNTNIYLHEFGADGAFGGGDDAGPLQLTTDEAEQRSPVIFGRRVVWLDGRDNDNYRDPEIYSYDLGADGLPGTADDGGEQHLALATVEPDELDLWGDRLVFRDYRSGSYDIWLYDFASGDETQITTAAGGQFYPRIHEKVIVWQDARNNAQGQAFDDIYAFVIP